MSIEFEKGKDESLKAWSLSVIVTIYGKGMVLSHVKQPGLGRIAFVPFVVAKEIMTMAAS